MAYENLQLAVAGVSGDIYLAKTKDGTMDTNHRRAATDDVLSSVTERSQKNEESAVHFGGIDGSTHSLFYIKDKERARKVIDTLEERQLINQRYKRR